MNHSAEKMCKAQNHPVERERERVIWCWGGLGKGRGGEQPRDGVAEEVEVSWGGGRYLGIKFWTGDGNESKERNQSYLQLLLFVTKYKYSNIPITSSLTSVHTLKKERTTFTSMCNSRISSITKS